MWFSAGHFRQVAFCLSASALVTMDEVRRQNLVQVAESDFAVQSSRHRSPRHATQKSNCTRPPATVGFGLLIFN